MTEPQVLWVDLELAVQPRMSLNSRLHLLNAGISGIHIMLDLCTAGGENQASGLRQDRQALYQLSYIFSP